ncbi:MAG: hypothetical protein JXQ75_06025 [Phycisphaerae bacterium]|nr:hypothetical protein [Phycisphaerae bacterium]
MGQYCRECGGRKGLNPLAHLRCKPGLGPGPVYCEDCGTLVARVGLWHYSECPKCVPASWNVKIKDYEASQG